MSDNGNASRPQRDAKGLFLPGNQVSKGCGGNPLAKKVHERRQALINAVSPQDIREIVAVLVDAAKNGDLVATKEILDRCLGKAEALDVLDRLEQLEERLAEFQSHQRW